MEHSDEVGGGTAETVRAAGSFDYVIIGAGSAGCVLANRLSADPAVRVLLLEAGKRDRSFWMSTPLGVMYLLGNPRFDWCYASEPEPFLNGRVIPLPRGRTMGGSSSINGMVYVRGLARDYDHWRQDGNVGWSWQDVLPYFIRSEDYHGGASEYRGAGGPLHVCDPGVRWEALDAYRDAAVEAGIPATTDYNRGDNEGIAYFEATIKGGVRWSTAKAFLEPALKRPNLTVLPSAQVERLALDGRRVTGVTFRREGVLQHAVATGEVLLSAGAIASPQLLQLSGIGPGAVLRDLGIPVLHDLPGVGENLHDHWQVRMRYRVHDTVTLNAWVDNPVRRTAMGLRYLLFRSGPLSAQPALMTTFAKSDPAMDVPDIQFHVSAASYGSVAGKRDPFPGFTTSTGSLRPTSRGHVRIRSRDPAAHPAILHNYLQTEQDCRDAVAGVRLARRVAERPALARFRPEEISPGAQAVSDDDILAFARETLSTVFHPVGTCRMGQDDTAVVDARLRVHGLAGLRVVDASVMPAITSGNTNAPTIMIAEKAADMIREDRRAAA